MSDSEWYSVVCFFVARIDGELLEDVLYEESHYIVKAESIEDATELATELASSACVSYANIYGQSVSWELAHPALVKEIDSPLVSGAEVFSRYMDHTTFRALVESGDQAPEAQSSVSHG